jgi:hypothetical protein
MLKKICNQFDGKQTLQSNRTPKSLTYCECSKTESHEVKVADENNCLLAVKFLMRRYLAMIGGYLPGHCLAMIKDTYRDTQTDGRDLQVYH